MNAAPSAQQASRWTFGRLLDAPHRLAFSAAALVLVLSSVWWASVNVAFSDGIALPWRLAPALAHSVLMSFGFMPLFFAGFLFTAGPKWLRQPAVTAREMLGAVLFQLAGWLVFLLAIHGRDPAFGRMLGGIGLAAVAIGWSQMTLRFWRLLRSSTVDDRVHAKLVAVGCMLGLLALMAATAGMALGSPPLLRAAVHAGLWAFNGVVFATVAHRMIPFFSAAAFPALDASRPLWLLCSLVAVFAFEAVSQLVDAVGAGAAPAWNVLRACIELPAGLGVLALAVRWGLVQNLRLRLLAMLHLGFSWLGISLLMFGLSHAAAAAGAGSSALGLAPIHAYTMGYLGTTMFTMVSRVSGGHGGRAQVADDFVWRLFWVLQLATLARIAAALVSRVSFACSMALVVAAALAWTGVFVAWALRNGHGYGRARPDGRPG